MSMLPSNHNSDILTANANEIASPSSSAPMPDSQQAAAANEAVVSPSKHHSQEADELDMLCRKLNDVRVRIRAGVDEEEIRLCDVVRRRP